VKIIRPKKLVKQSIGVTLGNVMKAITEYNKEWCNRFKHVHMASLSVVDLVPLFEGKSLCEVSVAIVRGTTDESLAKALYLKYVAALA